MYLSAARIVSKESQIELTEHTGGGYYVHATLDSHETDMLLDTGSKYVVLSKKTFNSIQHDHEMIVIDTIQGINANGSRGNYKVYLIELLTISKECILKDVKAVFMPSSTRDILGMNVLKSMSPFTIDLYSHTLTTKCV